MNSGIDDINKLGKLKTWNYDDEIPIWDGACANVEGTSGELWYPPRDDKSVKIFSPDICRYVFKGKLYRLQFYVQY